MEYIRKSFALILILLIAILSVIIPVSTSAQSIPTPSVPEFTVKFVDSSYDIPAKTSIDPYTGKSETTQARHVDNRTIELTIKNQPFIPQNDSNGNPLSLFYNVHKKGHYEENWTEIYNPEIYPTQSEATYTVITYISRDENTWELGRLLTDFPANAEIDFQVQALIGFTYAKHYSDDGQFIPFASKVFSGESSGWSNTQTITVPESSSTSPNPTSYPAPSIPEFSWLVVLPLCISILFIAVRLKQAKRLATNVLTMKLVKNA
jgi:hypothetical protein